MKAYHLTPFENLDQIWDTGLIPAVGPRSAELGETVPGIYVFPDRHTLEQALGSWLEDAFDPEAALSCLLIDLEGLACDSDVDYELRILEPVAPDRIALLSTDIWAETGIPALHDARPIQSITSPDTPEL